MWRWEALEKFRLILPLCLERVGFLAMSVFEKDNKWFGCLMSLKKLHLLECETVMDFLVGWTNFIHWRSWILHNVDLWGRFRMDLVAWRPSRSSRGRNVRFWRSFRCNWQTPSTLEEFNFSACMSLMKDSIRIWWVDNCKEPLIELEIMCWLQHTYLKYPWWRLRQAHEADPTYLNVRTFTYTLLKRIQVATPKNSMCSMILIWMTPEVDEVGFRYMFLSTYFLL